MTAISSTGGVSQPSSHTWLHPLAVVAAIGHLFATSQADVHTETEHEAARRKPRPPKRYASYYESGVTGRERFRL
jgi:hypothetical protein